MELSYTQSRSPRHAAGIDLLSQNHPAQGTTMSEVTLLRESPGPPQRQCSKWLIFLGKMEQGDPPDNLCTGLLSVCCFKGHTVARNRGQRSHTIKWPSWGLSACTQSYPNPSPPPETYSEREWPVSICPIRARKASFSSASASSGTGRVEVTDSR